MIVALGGPPTALAAKAASTTVPIVFTIAAPGVDRLTRTDYEIDPQAHCALTLAARITLPQVSISNLIRFANSSGVLATTS
jgi:hypothetical protein